MIEAEIRADSTGILDHMWDQAKSMVQCTALAHSVEAEITLQGRSGAGNSDPDLVEFVSRTAEGFNDRIDIRRSVNFKGSDDAAIMMEAVQKQGGRAVYMGFGSPLAAVHHNSAFDFDETVLSFGVDRLARLVRAAGGFRAD